MNKKHLELLGKTYLKTFDLSSFVRIDSYKALEWCKQQISEDWSLNEQEIKVNRKKNMNISGTDPDDYEVAINQIQDIVYLHGIRHFNANPDKAFIDVRLSDYTNIEKTIALLKPILMKKYSKFSPFGLRIMLCPKTVLTLSVEHQVFQKWLVACITDIRKKEYPENYDLIKLKPLMNQDYFATYQKLYAAFHEEFPNLIDDVSVNDLQTMELSRKHGLLYQIWVNHEAVGFIAGERNTFFGSEAIYFNEIVLHPQYKGLKLAAAAQRKFLDLEFIQEELVWGTIDSKNLPSLKTAQSVGRFVVQEEVFFPF